MRALSLLLGLWALAATPAWAAGPFDPYNLARVMPPEDARAPMNLVFRDQDGRSVTLAGLARGRPLVLAPVQHGCRTLCGLTLQGLAAAVAGQSFRPGRDFTLVAFGIDPREPPAAAVVSLRRLGGDEDGVAALVGDARSVAAVTGSLGYRYAWDPASLQYAHVAGAAVLEPDGRLARWIMGVAPSPADLHEAIDAARRGVGGGIVEQIRLLCFHYDPSTGRYSLAAWRLAQGASAACALALASGVGLAVWRGRRRRGAA